MGFRENISGLCSTCCEKNMLGCMCLNTCNASTYVLWIKSKLFSLRQRVFVIMVGHPSEQPPLATPPQAGGERHTTHENIRRFFDTNTYRKNGTNKECHVSNEKLFGGQSRCQKRPAPDTPSTAPKAKAKMNKDDLLEKFKLAAQLNGIDWDEMAVPRMPFKLMF